MGYRERLSRDLERWIAAGWVPEASRDSILEEAAARDRGWSAAGALAIMGAALIALAMLSFVAANWDGMARLFRFGLVIAALWAAFLGAGRAFDRGAPVLGHALALLGAALFGAAIALTAQTFNLSSFRNTAILIWALAALGVALLTPSRPVLILAVILGGTWSITESINDFAPDIIWTYPLLWAVMFTAASRMKAPVSVHLLAASIIGWLAWAILQYGENDLITPMEGGSAFALACGALALAGAALRDRQVFGAGGLTAWTASIAMLSGWTMQLPLSAYARARQGEALSLNNDWSRLFESSGDIHLWTAGAALAAIVLLTLWRMRSGGFTPRDGLVLIGGAAAAALAPILVRAAGPEAVFVIRLVFGGAVYAVSVLLILYGAREERRGLGAIGIVGFIGQSLYVYAETFGNGLMDTALFFLVGGLILFGLSAALLRMQRALSQPAPPAGRSETEEGGAP